MFKVCSELLWRNIFRTSSLTFLNIHKLELIVFLLLSFPVEEEEDFMDLKDIFQVAISLSQGNNS